MVGRSARPPGLTVSEVDETILVEERGQLLEFSYNDMLCYAGPYSPAGVANAFKVMQRAFAALSPNHPPQRRSIVIRTAFQGPGARDGFEAVTRAVTDGHYTVDPALARPDRGRLLQSFVFQITIAGRTATLFCVRGSSPLNSSTSQANPTAIRPKRRVWISSRPTWRNGCWPRPPKTSSNWSSSPTDRIFRPTERMLRNSAWSFNSR